MPSPARRLIGAVLAGLGIALAVAGAWATFKLGPSGEAQFVATSKAPGGIIVGPEVLNAVDVPVRVAATRGDGGAIRLSAARSSDVLAVVGESATSSVSGVHYPAGTMDLRASGTGALHDLGKSDVWRLSATGTGSAELVVDQGNGPETAVVTSGDASALTNVTMTLTWANGTWLAQALITALTGAIIAVVAIRDLRGGSRPARPADASGRTGSEVTA